MNGAAGAAAPDADVLVSGGGPVGAACALALHDAGLRVLLAEARPAVAVTDDPRVLALSEGARLILARIGVWDALAPHSTPIREIHVSQRGAFGRALLGCGDLGLRALGYVAAYAQLVRVLGEALVARGVPVVTGTLAGDTVAAGDRIVARVGVEAGAERTLSARLLVRAEGAAGGGGTVRDYRQHAIAATVHLDVPSRGRAWERFTADGPIALLPCGEGYALVWTVASDRVEAVLGLDDAAFLSALQDAFGMRAGVFRSCGRRQSFPLRLAVGDPVVPARTVLVGNAAQTLHPVAGQGFNLGLRDAWELVAATAGAPDPGAARVLDGYLGRRRLDRRAGIGLTDALVGVFLGGRGPLPVLRGIGLTALDTIGPVRKAFMRRMIYGVRD